MDVVPLMWEYQKKMGIKDQCITNAQYIYDSLKFSGVSSARVCATQVIHKDEEVRERRVITHLVVRVNDIIVDASYDIASLKGKKYCFTVAEMVDTLKEQSVSPEFKKRTIKNFVEFLDLARRMNAGEILVADKDHYNQQADFLEEALPELAPQKRPTRTGRVNTMNF
jgi:hypothetical protein